MNNYDIIIVTPDSYIDHPSFAAAMLKHNLVKAGYKTAVLDKPKWQTKDYLRFGKPALFWAVSGGNVDSLVMNYTPSGKKRKTDDYQINGSPYFQGMALGEKSRIRPDRCVTVYVNGIKNIDHETPVVIGGIEASMRRLAHYDFLTDRVRSSVLVDSGADLLVYGMGEKTICEIAHELKNGNPINKLQIKGTCRLLQKGEKINGLQIPSFDLVREDKTAFVEMTEKIHENTNPFTACVLMQKHAGRTVVQFPTQLPLTEKEIDEIYNCNFNFGFDEKLIPAAFMIKDSITIHRGCFGGCSFCALGLHQGKYIQSRSINSIKNEIIKRSKINGFSGIINDLGGPSANMYKMDCRNKKCDKLSCLSPEKCKNINGNSHSAKTLYEEVLNMKDKNGKKLIKNLSIGSGIRFDLAIDDLDYVNTLVSDCLSGNLKIAPEHFSENVLRLMNKPYKNEFIDFIKIFNKISSRIGKKQKIIPYIMVGHPGETMEDVLELRDFLMKNRITVEQVQIFTPTPMTLSTCAYYTGIMPFSREEVIVCRDTKELTKRKELIVSR